MRMHSRLYRKVGEQRLSAYMYVRGVRALYLRRSTRDRANTCGCEPTTHAMHHLALLRCSRLRAGLRDLYLVYHLVRLDSGVWTDRRLADAAGRRNETLDTARKIGYSGVILPDPFYYSMRSLP